MIAQHPKHTCLGVKKLKGFEMRLRRMTSVEGLSASLLTLTNGVQGNLDSINIINGDAAVPGSIAHALAAANTYTDAAIAGVDLSQVETNRLALLELNGPESTPESVLGKIKACKDTLIGAWDAEVTAKQALIQTNSDAIAILNGGPTVVGSIAKAVADIIDGSPANLDTLKEVSDLIATQDSVHTAFITQMANDKTDCDDALAAHILAYETNKTAVNDKFALERTQTNTDMAAAAAAYDVLAEGKFFQIANLFGELVAPADKQTARDNLGAISAVDAATIITDNKFLHMLVTGTVTGGKITIETTVAAQHIDYIHIVHPGGAYDDIVLVAGPMAGEWIVQDAIAGDLDGETFEIKYVVDQSIPTAFTV